jgi:hypothetical protein
MLQIFMESLSSVISFDEIIAGLKMSKWALGCEMKSIKKMVAASTLAATLLGFGFNPEPVEARGLVCFLFGCKKAVVKDIDKLYGEAPDFDSIYGKEPPDAQNFNPNGPSPYGRYGNKLENIMGRDVREIIELDRRYNKRVPGYGNPDTKTFFRALSILPLGELEKSIPLEDGNIAYYFFKEGSANPGNPGTPDRLEPGIISVPFDKYTYGAQTTYTTTPGTPRTAPSGYWYCKTYVIANPEGKLIHWSYKSNHDEVDLCGTDKRRIR